MAKKRIIFSIKCGTPPYTSLTLPRIIEYAEQVKSDFRMLTDQDLVHHPECKWPHMLIFSILHIFANSDYDQMLYLDLDILIKERAPNIFSQHPRGFWMAKDPQGRGLRTHSHATPYSDWLENKLGIQLSDYPSYKTYFNSGVILTDRSSAIRLCKVIEPPYRHAMPHLKDQHQLNAFIMQSTIQPNTLSQKWNQTPESEDGIFTHYLAKKHKEKLKSLAVKNPFNIFEKAR